MFKNDQYQIPPCHNNAIKQRMEITVINHSPLKVTLYLTYGNNRTWCFISVITENKPHAHHETHLHTMKVVTILIHSFHGLR